MTKTAHFVFSLMITFSMIFIARNAIAGSDWQEKQKQIFSQVSVKPGDVINKTNCETVKDLLPEPFYNVIKNGDWILNIGEFGYDYDFDEDYYKLSAGNEGKYILGDKKEILDARTGTYPMFVRGMPFPNINFENDADAAAKFMHNRDVNLFMASSWNGESYPPQGNLVWVGRNSGYERGVGFINETNYFWNRTGGEIENPRKLKFTNFLLSQTPYDLKGTATLYLRHLDGRADSVYAYVPAIRRVKRLSGANRSDPQMGSDQTADDADGFSGHIESMEWTFLGKKIMLKPIYKKEAQAPRELQLNKYGGWGITVDETCKLGYEVEGWSGAPWAFVNLVWIPAEMVILKARPLNPFYTYGDMILYLDATSTTSAFTLKYTKAGEIWKYMVYSASPVIWKGGKKYLSMFGPSCVVDVKTDHASPAVMDFKCALDSPRVNPCLHSPRNLRTATK